MASLNDKSNTDSAKESVLMNLRSVTQSRKGGVPLACLERDYKDLLGTPIPYRELGYNTIQSFLKDIPHVIKLSNKDGQFIAEGVADSTTAHIVSLVNRQKAAPKLRPSRRGARRGGYSSKYSFSRSKATNFQTSPRVTSYQGNKHSKTTFSVSKESKPKTFKAPSPEPPKVQNTPARKYEVAPRFLKLQQKRHQAANQTKPDDTHENFRPESPNKQYFRPETPPDPYPQNFIIEAQTNNHIKSPRPLQTVRTVTIDRKKKKSLDTAKKYIEAYAEENGLEVSYVTKPYGQKKFNKGFISSLSLGEKKYHSYPEHASTAQEAEELAAKSAVKAIEESQEHLASCPETSIRNVEEIRILIDRIEEIVCEKPSGMFTNGIISEYETKYNEMLPVNWLSILQNSTIIEIEELDGRYGRVPKGVTHIVRRAKFSSGSTTPSSTSEIEKPEYGYEDNIIQRNIVRKDQIPQIPELTIPFGNEWAVYIVDVSKTIAARLIEYDKEFLNMSQDMQNFYAHDSLPALEISEGLLYAARDADSDIFHRVLVQTIKDDISVECYFVDDGIFATVLKADLQELYSDFWKLPYQAIHMELEGFDDYPLKSEDLKCILGSSLIALVKRWTTTTVQEYFPKDPAVHKIIYSVVLYDTNNDDDININETIKDKIIAAEIPILPKPSISGSGYYLTHIENNGEIFLRKLPPFESWLETSLEGLSDAFEVACTENMTIPLDKICVAKYEDGKWYRAKLLPNAALHTDPDKVEVFFVDYGNTSIVSIKEVCELDNYSDFLVQLAPQAIKCELFNPFPSSDVEWTPAATEKLIDLAPLNEALIIRVINETENSNPAKVNLYKRTYQNGDSFIISINESLANIPELFKSSPQQNSSVQNSSLKLNFKSEIPPPVPRTTHSNNIDHASESFAFMPTSPANELKWALTPDIKSPDAFDGHDPQPISLPEVPEIGEQFDVFVTMAAHPHNFYIQPFKTFKEMNDLMVQMKQFYSSEDNLIDMPLSLLKIKDFYAVKHKDGSWYRAQLQGIVNTDPTEVVVKLIDFGDIITVTMQQLQILYGNFRQLPCQGIEASLSGVKPIDKDWDLMHNLKFSQMIKEREYVSMIQNKCLKDDLDMPVLKLELILIDVSDPIQDIYIHELLIEKGMALPK